MTRTGRVVVAVCTVAILLVLAWMVGPVEYEVPPDLNQKTVKPMTDEEVWGS